MLWPYPKITREDQPSPRYASDASARVGRRSASVPGLVCQLSPPTNIFLQDKQNISPGDQRPMHRHWGERTCHVPRVVGHLGGAVCNILVLGFHGLGRRRAHYDYERATARRGRLPESLGCTTDYRHETGARRTPPRSARRRPPAPRAPLPPPPHRFIHSVHNYSYAGTNARSGALGTTTWARGTCSRPLRPRAAPRARPPAPTPRRTIPSRPTPHLLLILSFI